MHDLCSRHLTGMLNGALGCDVFSGDLMLRGLLAREERQQDDGQGFGVMVWVTTLTMKADELPLLRQDDRLDVGPQRAPWHSLPKRSDCTTYTVRKIGRTDDFGARELILGDVSRGNG